jgi:hypothetical protein
MLRLRRFGEARSRRQSAHRHSPRLLCVSLSLRLLALKMKTLLLLPFFSSIVFAGSNADKILTEYYQAVSSEISQNTQSLGMDGVLEKYDELGKKYLLANKEDLHKKAVEDYLNLPELDFVVLEKQERIAWIQSSQFKKGNTIEPGLAKTPLDQVVLFFSESGYNIPPFDRTVLATLWWDPVKAARTIRELSFRRHLPPTDVEQRKFIEQYTPPMLFRLGKDGEHPCIAFFDGRELFALDLTYMKEGLYALAALKWVKMK